MHIRQIEFRRCEMPLEDKSWTFAKATVSAARGVVVRIESDAGVAGYGYAPAIAHMGSTVDGLLAELGNLAPDLEGGDPYDLGPNMKRLDDRLEGAVQAKSALDCAMHDLIARSEVKPLHRLLGGRYRDRIPVLRILAIKTPEEMATQAGKLCEAGYSHLKIKVHGEVGLDIARVRAIRAAVGSSVHLTVDANQAYSVKDAIRAINGMADYDLDLVEQPVHRHDIEGLARVTAAATVPVEADESAGTLHEIARLARTRAIDAVSLKLPKLGGIRNTFAAATLCEAHGIGVRIGAHVGTQLLNAHAVQVAAALPVLGHACELGEFERMSGDPFEGLRVENGEITVPSAAGCGVEPINDHPAGRVHDRMGG